MFHTSFHTSFRIAKHFIFSTTDFRFSVGAEKPVNGLASEERMGRNGLIFTPLHRALLQRNRIKCRKVFPRHSTVVETTELG